MTKGWIYFYGIFTGWNTLAMLDAFIENRIAWGIFHATMTVIMVFISILSLKEK